MTVNYLMLIVTGLYLTGTVLYYQYAKRKGIVFRYKPLTLFLIAVLFLLSLYGLIVGKPFNEIVPFIR